MKYFILALLLFFQIGSAAVAENTPGTKLVIVLIVDQLRPDFLARFSNELSPDGFRSLYKAGTSYSNAYFFHSHTETAPGHATIATGVDPREHGITGNSWIAPGSDASQYCVSDPGVEGGMSPNQLAVPTVGDRLVQADPQNRVYAVSSKDRAAILTAGKKGKAFWFNNLTQSFVSSGYYRMDLPKWFSPITAECSIASMADFTKGDLVTIDLALGLIAHEKLGRGTGKDLLFVSLSQTDRIGHRYGWDGPEMRKHIIELDRAVAKFLNTVKKNVGMNRTAIVLTADHGGMANSDLHGGTTATAKHIFSTKDFGIDLSKKLEEKFGLKPTAYTVRQPYLSLRDSALTNLKVDRAAVIEFIAQELENSGVVERAVPTSKLPQLAETEKDELYGRMLANQYDGRSGELYLVPKYGTILHDQFESPENFNFLLHGSPWDYDSHVPLVFVGPGYSPGAVVDTRVKMSSLAVSLGRLLGIPQSTSDK